MVGDRIERYEIFPEDDGVRIVAWFVLPRVGAGVIALVMLAACWATDPYVGHGRFWLGAGVVALTLVAALGVRVETWVIAATAIQYQTAWWSRERHLALAPGAPVTVRIELLSADSEGNRPPYPHGAHLMGPDDSEIGEGLWFRDRTNLDQFIERLQTVAPIDMK